MSLVEFNGHKSVMNARREYMSIVRNRATPGNESTHMEQVGVKQIALVYEVAKSLGFKITEGELRTEAYIAEGMLMRDNILIDSQKAMRDLATSQQKMLELVQATAARNAQPGDKP